MVSKVDSSYPIALRLQQSTASQRFPLTTTQFYEGERHVYTDSEVYDLSPSALVLPADADFRFRRFVRTYNLRLDDPPEGNMLTLGPNGGEDEEETGAAQGDSPEFKNDQPRWMLWTLAESAESDPYP